MARYVEEPAASTDQTINLVVAVEELNGLSSQGLCKLLKESENFSIRITKNGSLIQIDMEKLASSLPLHLIAVLLSPGGGDMRWIYFLRGIRLLHSLTDVASRHTRLEQILLEEVKVTEQVLDLVFYVLLVLASCGQENNVETAVPLLHSTLVACSLHLLTGFVSSQWQDLVQVLLAHPKVDIFLDVTFDAIHVDIRYLSTKLSALNSDVLTNKSSISTAERTANHICQQCEASLQFILSLCQQKVFRDRILANKELCRNGAILSLAQKTLNLDIPQCFKDSSEMVAAVSRQKSKVLSILLQLCEAESVSYLDEVAGCQKSMDLAKSVVLEILDLLKGAFSREAKQLTHSLGKTNPKGLVVLNSMRLADIFSDDSNFRSFFMANTTKVLAEILAMPHEDFFSCWCSTDVPMTEDDSIVEYDLFMASGTAVSFFTGSAGNPFEEPILPSEANVACPGSLKSMLPVSYAQQRISYLVKIIANLHCFVPNICEDDEKYLFLHKFLECLCMGSYRLPSNIPINCDSRRAATICKNLGSLSVYAESLIPHLLNEEDVQLLSDFYKQLLQAIPSSSQENYIHEQLAKDGGVLVKNTSESSLMLQDSLDWAKNSNSNFSEGHESKTETSFQDVYHNLSPAHEHSGNDDRQLTEVQQSKS
uniref:Serine/threonine-protein kinase TEL1 n=1 Tax=Anthurium amnicola TaxID=1678845 RepID=A0A1D1YIM6_9ARAE